MRNHFSSLGLTLEISVSWIIQVRTFSMYFGPRARSATEQVKNQSSILTCYEDAFKELVGKKAAPS
jgi:apolipoprotein N-acyltransferase